MKMSYISHLLPAHLLLALRTLCKGCYRFHRFYAFSCGRAKSIQIRFVWTRIVLESGATKLSFSRISRIHADRGLYFLWWFYSFYFILNRKGSIIAEFKVTFKTSLTTEEAKAPLKQETADGKLGSLEVDSNSLKLKDNNQGKWVEPWIHGLSRLNIYMVVEYSSSSLEISAKASTPWKWVVTFVDSIRLYIVIEMIT